MSRKYKGSDLIIPKVRGKRLEDYDGYDDYNPFIIEQPYER